MKRALIVSILLNLVFGGMLCFRRAASVESVIPARVATKTPIVRVLPRASAPHNANEDWAQRGERPKQPWTGTASDLYAQLKAAGAPPLIVRAVLARRDKVAMDEKMQDLRYPNGKQRWSAPVMLSKEGLEKRQALADEQTAQMKGLMGPDYERAGLEMDPPKALKWGKLSDQELAEAGNLTQKYHTELSNGRATPGSPDAAAMDAAYEQGIRAALGLSADDFLTFNSGRALALQSELSAANIVVSEGDYRILFQAGGAAGISFGGPLSVQQTEIYETVIGSEQTLKIVSMKDRSFQQIDSLLSTAGQNASTRMSVYYEYQDALSNMTALRRANPADKATTQQYTAAMAHFYDRIADKIPPQQLAALRQLKVDPEPAGPQRFLPPTTLSR